MSYESVNGIGNNPALHPWAMRAGIPATRCVWLACSGV